jgi:hypothetical protein
MATAKINRRNILKIGGFTSVAYFLNPIQKVMALSAARMRRARRLNPGPLLVSQFLISVLALDNSQTLRSSQVVQSVLARDESQTLRSSQTLLIVLVPT